MHHYEGSRVMPFRREQLFELVADVERYSEFLPAWLTARIVERKGDEMIVDQVVGIGAFPLEFVSHTSLRPPDHIQVIARDGPFRYLEIHWRFVPVAASACRIELSVEFELSSPLFEWLLSMLFKMTLRQVLRDFDKRARDLYGPEAGAGDARG